MTRERAFAAKVTPIWRQILVTLLQHQDTFLTSGMIARISGASAGSVKAYMVRNRQGHERYACPPGYRIESQKGIGYVLTKTGDA